VQCLQSGRSKEAFAYLSRAVDVTPAMARRWINALRGVEGVQFVVAPYEVRAVNRRNAIRWLWYIPAWNSVVH
jgi:hypothetical protein